MTEKLSHEAWLEQLRRVVMEREYLTSASAYQMMDAIMNGDVNSAAIASLLTALTYRGVKAREVLGFANAMRDHALPLDVDTTGAVDIVGTGGDRANTVNISTMAAVLLAASGVKVIKHGNRASTSKCGSADLLEKLGIVIDLKPQQVAQVYREVGITFCFAMSFHPAMRYAGPVRRSLRFPTVFNLLGPLTNPGRPPAYAIGATTLENQQLIAQTLAARGDRGLVFSGVDTGVDELTCIGAQRILEARHGEVTETVFDAHDFGCEYGDSLSLRGGDAGHNAQIAHDVFAGKNSGVAQVVALNAAAGVVAAAPDEDSEEPLMQRLVAAYGQMRETLASGVAAIKLAQWQAATQAF